MRLEDYDLVSELHHSDRAQVTRQRQRGTGQEVVIKALPAERQHAHSMARLRYEHKILQHLNAAGARYVPRALRLIDTPGVLALVTEDLHGVSLRQAMAAQPLSLLAVLQIGHKLSTALVDAHRAQVVHKDINPNNIVYNVDSAGVQLIDYDMASQLEHELQAVESLDALEGTLPYISPEQTGRLSHALDYRSDFFSLGVTLYELLTEQLPFAGSDPAQVVYGILTQLPANVCTLKPGLPTTVGGIVARLMHKDPRGRYQSAAGLQRDLARCLTELQARGDVSHFEPGADDASERFEISQRLYGREFAAQQLQAAYARVSPGRQEFVLMAGASGIGKSALVGQLQTSMLANAGLFGAGKSELLHRHRPFAALTQALAAVLRHLLCEPSAALGRWARRLQAAVGRSAQAVIDVVPELGLLLGPQKAVATLAAQESENRLLSLMQNLLQGLAKAQPLVLFLDDLQWADHGTLKLLQRVANEPHRGEGLLLLGAYRDNEVTRAHPLHGAGKFLQTEHTQVTELAVLPLNSDEVTALVQDTTRTDAATARPLAELLVAKTGGNPFFLHEFLKTLHAGQIIVYAPQQHSWRWEMQAVRTTMVTANMADLLAHELRALPSAECEVMNLGACIGSEVRLETLALASDLTREALLDALQNLLGRGLLLPVGGAYRYAADEPKAAVYRFAHDKIAQAAYELMSPEVRTRQHLVLGRVLLASQGSKVSQVVHHFNQALGLVYEQGERLQVGNLNVLACEQARLAAAYDLAIDYGHKALELLAAQAWEAQPAVHAQLHLNLAQALALAGRPEAALPHLDAVEAHASTRVEALTMARERLLLMVVARQPKLAQNAVGSALKVLRLPLPAQPKPWHVLRAFVTLQWRLRGRRIADLARLSDRPNEELREAERLLVAISYAGMAFVDPLLFLASTFYTACLPLPAGVATAQMCVALVPLNMSLNRYRAAHQWADLMRSRLHTCSDAKSQIVCRYILLSQIDHENFTASAYLEQNDAMAEWALEVGDAMNADNIAVSGTFVQAAMSVELCAVRLNQPPPIMQMMREYQPPSYDAFRLAMDALQGKGGDGKLQMTYEAYRKQAPTDLPVIMVRGPFFALELWVAYVHRDLTSAVPLMDRCAKDGLFAAIPHVCTMIMAMLAVLIYTQSGAPRPLWWRLVTGRIRKAAAAGTTYRGFALLMDAELAAQGGQAIGAHALYDAAVTALQPTGYVMFVAMALENAGRLHARTQVHSAAAALLSRARDAYRAWGATYKVRQLEQEFASYGLRGALHGSSSSSSSRRSERLKQNDLDLPAILAATQALTAEVVHDELIAKILLALEQSTGATRSALLLRHGDALQVAADSRGEGAPLPNDLLRYVLRSQKPVMVDAIDRAPEFKEALRVLEVKAMLCVPVMQHGAVRGVIYLESAVASGVFGPERMLLVSVLASQAAIALENARLYAQQEGLVAQRTEELRAAHARLLQLERAATESQMAGGFAHEMRNALASAAYALGAVEDVAQGLDSMVAQHAVRPSAEAAAQIQSDAAILGQTFGVVGDAIDRAMQITDKIMAYAQMGELHVGDDSAVLSEVLQRVLQGTDAILVQHGVRTEVTCDPQLRLPMRADHVEVVLQNLLANAVDAMKSQSATNRRLTIAAAQQGERVMLTVEDSGVGISDAHAARIFQPFFSTKGAHGAGLGLAVCKKIVQAYGGSIGFAPAQPRGTAFKVEIDWR